MKFRVFAVFRYSHSYHDVMAAKIYEVTVGGSAWTVLVATLPVRFVLNSIVLLEGVSCCQRRTTPLSSHARGETLLHFSRFH